MTMKLFCVVFILLALQMKSCTADQCVWYGECGESKYEANPCQYNGPPQQLNETDAQDALKSMCGDMFDSSSLYGRDVSGGGPKVCCDRTQINSLQKLLGLAQRHFSRCPSCVKNFQHFFCQLTCAPNQAKFMYASSTMVSKKDSTKRKILQVEIAVAKVLADNLYQQCADVQKPFPNSQFPKAISLFCGTTAEKCTPEQLLKFLGNTQNTLKIFHIATEPVDVTLKPPPTFLPETIRIDPAGFNNSFEYCDKHYDGSAPCSCQDCSASCGATPEPTLPPGTTTELGTTVKPTLEPRPSPEECLVSRDAKFLEGLVRAELMVVKMTHSRELQTFLLNKTTELRNSMNAAQRLFEIMATDEDGIGGRVASSADRWSPVRHLFEAVDNLQQINATHSKILLHDSHHEINNLLERMHWAGSHQLKRGLILILESALRRCRQIVENGCKENPTAPPTSYPWETTWNP